LTFIAQRPSPDPLTVFWNPMVTYVE